MDTRAKDLLAAVVPLKEQLRAWLYEFNIVAEALPEGSRALDELCDEWTYLQDLLDMSFKPLLEESA